MSLKENTHIGNSYVIDTEDGDGFNVDITLPIVDFNDKFDDVRDASQNIILAQGGFGVDITLPEIEFLDETLAVVSSFDLTNTIRISFDVRLFNEKIGLYKDQTNRVILDSSFNPSTGWFPALSISFDFDEFNNSISSQQIISLGSFRNIYNDFTFQVQKYFHFPPNFKLFNKKSTSELNQNVFGPSEFIRTMNDKIADTSGNVVNAFSGGVIMYGINQILAKLVKNDTFLNRASKNYTHKDGFIAGDKILIIPGITFDMGVTIGNPHSLNIQNLSSLTPGSYHGSDYSRNLLQKQYRAPILLELNNLS